MYRLSEIDIRLLHVFRTVVDCRGFTNAQASLNISQSTISNHIGQLEHRLGFRLCDRGRTGFRLTQKGESVYEQLLELFKAHEHFQNVTMELKGRLSGFLKLGIIDSTVTDPMCPVVRGINLFNNKAHEATVRISILTPNELERAVLDTDIDIAVGTFDHALPELNYEAIYTEKNTLYCSLNHPIANILSEPVSDTDIEQEVHKARKVTRAYLEGKDLFKIGEKENNTHASVEFLEAAAILLLAGGHIGFLPIHYAKNWVTSGVLVPILPEKYIYESNFFIVTRKKMRKSLIVDTFMSDLLIATNEIKHEFGL